MGISVQAPCPERAATGPSRAQVHTAQQPRARSLHWAGVAAALIVVGGGLFFTAARAMGQTAEPADARITLIEGQPAPDFALTSVAGQEVRLSDYRGKQPVLLYFQEGAMCSPCWRQMRELESNEARLDALNVVLVTITVDPPEMLAGAALREDVEGMTILYDAQAQVSQEYQALYVSMHPGVRPGHAFVLIDAEGIIRWRQDYREMYVPSEHVLDAIQAVLEPPE